MARRQRVDRAVKARLDELETRLFQLKILYEKYFNGLEKMEPGRERDDVRRMVRALTREHFTSTAQRYRFQTLRARFNSLDLYITRNLVQIERGTHPKFKFRADLADRRRYGDKPPPATGIAAIEARRKREESAYRQVYDKYLQARERCGQSTDLEFQKVRQALVQQVRRIKTRYECQSVRFRIAVEDGQVRLKAVPLGARKGTPGT